MNKLIFALSLARKSGKLIYGSDRVKDALAKGSAKLVITAGDVSVKTRENTEYFAQGIAPCYNTALSQFDLSQVTGRLRGVLAVTDENLAVLCMNAIKETEGEG